MFETSQSCYANIKVSVARIIALIRCIKGFPRIEVYISSLLIDTNTVDLCHI